MKRLTLKNSKLISLMRTLWVWFDQTRLTVIKQPTNRHQILIQMLLNPDP